MSTSMPPINSSGAITGFDSITTADGQQIQQVNHSIADLYALIQDRFKNVQPAYLRQIEALILSHVQATNNPHDDQLAQMITSFSGDLLSGYVPGTAPLSDPVVSYYADTPFGNPISESRASPIYTLNKAGLLTFSDVNVPAIDWSTGKPVLLLRPQYTQLLNNTDVTTTTAASVSNLLAITKGAAGAPAYMNTVLSPNNDSAYVLLRESAQSVATQFSYNITVPTLNGGEYTTSLFVYPSPQNASGYIRLFSVESGIMYADISLADGSVVNSNSGVIGTCQILPNGWYRIGLQYRAVQNGTQTLAVIACPTLGTTSYIPNGHDLFSVFGINHTQTRGLAPFVPSSAASQTVAAGTATLNAFKVGGISYAQSTTGMLSCEYTANVSLLSGLAPEFLIKTQAIGTSQLPGGNGLSVVINPQNVVASFYNRTPYGTLTAPLKTGASALALSFATTGNAMKHTGVPRTSFVGAMNGAYNYADDFVFGPFEGGITSFNLYTSPDTSGSTLEFLVGEK